MAPTQQAESVEDKANQAKVQAQARQQPRHRIQPLILYFFIVAGLIFFCFSFLTWINDCSISISQSISTTEQPISYFETDLKMSTEQTYVSPERANRIRLSAATKL